MGSRFPIGQLVATPGALDLGVDFIPYLLRHVSGDWGIVNKQDADENELSVKQGFRILSAYETPNGEKFWIITEADRSSTCILLPDEY